MTIILKSYSAHRHSGAGWLGEIPAHWKLQSINSVIESSVAGLWGEDISESNADDQIRCIRVADFASWALRVSVAKSTYRAVPPGALNGRLLELGDVLIEKSGGGDVQPVGRVVLYRGGERAITSNFVSRLRANHSRVEPSFLLRILDHLQRIRVNALSIKQTTGIQNLDDRHYFSNSMPLPPLDEQRAIADFLDVMDARITRFIAAKRRMIALLEEKKQAVINRAVTRGLDPDVPLKDFGVEWLGEIPGHWEVRRIKSLAKLITSGSRDWAAHYADTGAVFLRIGNLSTTSVDLKLTNIQHVEPPPGAKGTRTRVLPGDVLISITAQMGAVGLVPEGLGEAYINQHTALVRLTRASFYSRWVAYSLLSDLGKRQCDMRTNGGTKQGLGLDDVASLIVLDPPLQEQLAIVEHIDHGTERIAAIIDRSRPEIELI
jgi:type I restriction enzyme, S subunit